MQPVCFEKTHSHHRGGVWAEALKLWAAVNQGSKPHFPPFRPGSPAPQELRGAPQLPSGCAGQRQGAISGVFLLPALPGTTGGSQGYPHRTGAPQPRHKPHTDYQLPFPQIATSGETEANPQDGPDLGKSMGTITSS